MTMTLIFYKSKSKLFYKVSYNEVDLKKVEEWVTDDDQDGEMKDMDAGHWNCCPWNQNE